MQLGSECKWSYLAFPEFSLSFSGLTLTATRMLELWTSAEALPTSVTVRLPWRAAVPACLLTRPPFRGEFLDTCLSGGFISDDLNSPGNNGGTSEKETQFFNGTDASRFFLGVWFLISLGRICDLPIWTRQWQTKDQGESRRATVNRWRGPIPISSHPSTDARWSFLAVDERLRRANWNRYGLRYVRAGRQWQPMMPPYSKRPTVEAIFKRLSASDWVLQRCRAVPLRFRSRPKTQAARARIPNVA